MKFIIIRDARLLEALLQCLKVNRWIVLGRRIDCQITTVSFDNKLKPFLDIPYCSLHNITSDPSKLRLYYNFFPQFTTHHTSSFMRASDPRMRKIAFVWSCEIRASERCRIAAISLRVISS